MNIDIDIDYIINNAIIVLNNQKIPSNKKTIKQILMPFINGCIEHFNKNPPFPPLSEINRRAIAHIVDKIKNIPKIDYEYEKSIKSFQKSAQSLDESREYINQLNNQPRFPAEIARYETPLTDIQNDIQLQLPKTELIEKDNDTDNTFLKKLEDLEITRNNLNTNVPAPSPVPIISNTPSQPINQQVIAAPTVIYVPTKVKLSDLKQIVINSYDRDWCYSTNRSIFVYSGPIPSGENIKLGFAGIFLPKNVATLTPIIIIEIEGAGGQKQNILCTLSFQGVIWDMWNILRTPDSKDANLKNISCPWTIKLYDIYNELLNLGNDSQIITNVEILMNKNASIELNNNSDIDNNNIITIKKGNKDYGKFKIINKNNERYQIESIENNKNYSELQDGLICNMTKQVIMIIEIKKNELK